MSVMLPSAFIVKRCLRLTLAEANNDYLRKNKCLKTNIVTLVHYIILNYSHTIKR